MKKFDLTYEQRLKILNIKSLENRRKIQILKLLFKIKSKFIEIDYKWINSIVFYETTRHGIKCKKQMNRLCISDKHIFDVSVNLFNELP